MTLDESQARHKSLNKAQTQVDRADGETDPEDAQLMYLAASARALVDIAQSLQTLERVFDNWSHNAVPVENIHE